MWDIYAPRILCPIYPPSESTWSCISIPERILSSCVFSFHVLERFILLGGIKTNGYTSGESRVIFRNSGSDSTSALQSREEDQIRCILGIYTFDYAIQTTLSFRGPNICKTEGKSAPIFMIMLLARSIAAKTRRLRFLYKGYAFLKIPKILFLCPNGTPHNRGI